MAKENKSVKKFPNLRFPGFEGEWETKTLGEIGDVKMCRRIFNDETSSAGEIPFFKIGSFGKVADAFISKNLYLDYKNRFSFPKKGDILISAAGTIGRTVVYNGEDAYYQDSNIVWIDNDNTKITNEFLYHILQIVKYNTEGGTIQRLYNNILKSTKFSCPSILEQNKISTFLNKIEDRIQTQRKIISQLKSQMSNLKDLLFEQKLRFNNNNDNEFPDWKYFRLSDLGNTFNGLSGKTKEHFGVGQKYIQYKQIFDSAKINIGNCAFVDVKENENQNIVRYGDVFFTISSETPEEIGMSSVLLENVDNVYLNSFCFSFRTNSFDELIPEFSQFLFRSNKFRNEIIKLAQGSTRYNMSKTEFLKLKVKLPCKDEQIKISQFLSSIGEKINVESELLFQYENQKKYLLQNLFI